MNCPDCSTTLSDTAKFCGQCGTRRPLEGDDELALVILNAGCAAIGADPVTGWDQLNKCGRPRAIAELAKARELLCAPLQADVERLKAELANTRAALDGYRCLDDYVQTHTDEVEDMFREVISGRHYGNVATEWIERLRTAAANARREALREVRELAMVYLVNRPPAVDVFMVKLDALPRDASQPAAETHTPACQHPDHMRMGSAGADGTVSSRCTACGNTLYERNLGTGTVEGVARNGEQPPVRDVEELALHLWRECGLASKADAEAVALAAIAFLDGGPTK